jgi:SAM-dependent methyltransferase
MTLETLAQWPPLRKLVRTASDWVDLQLSLIVASLRDVAPQARGRLLDVGCGNKPYESFFTPYVTEYLGIEHEATFTETAAGSQGTRPDLTYDGDRLPFADQTFDTVLSVQVLEHTPRPRALVGEMARVLKSGGLMILLAPFQFRLHEQPHDYFRYSSHGLRHLCEEAGLDVVEVRPQGSLWSVIGHKLNSYLAFRVGRIGGMAQAIGKLGHEATVATVASAAPTATAAPGPRLWTLPFVGVSMVAIATAARVLDPLLPEPDETLNFIVLARRR